MPGVQHGIHAAQLRGHLRLSASPVGLGKMISDSRHGSLRSGRCRECLSLAAPSAMTDADLQQPPYYLLGPTVDPRYYDDDRALTEYVWKHFQDLMTPLELRVYSVPIMSDINDEKGRRIHACCESRHGHADDADVIAAFPRDLESFRLKARQRLMQECAGSIFVSRCPECSRIVRSPSAHQCPWCKHKWHNA